MNEILEFAIIEDDCNDRTYTARLIRDREKYVRFSKLGTDERDTALAIGLLWRKYPGEIMRGIVESNEHSAAQRRNPLQIKTFESYTTASLDEVVNKWLSENVGIDVINIHIYPRCMLIRGTYSESNSYVATITYKREVSQ